VLSDGGRVVVIMMGMVQILVVINDRTPLPPPPKCMLAMLKFKESECKNSNLRV